MSGTTGKCPEMIGYVGDVRNLEEDRGIAISGEKIIQWVKSSNSVRYATLFYSEDDLWKVSQKSTQLLKINPDLQIKQIGDIQKFINYVYSGMDRSQHPVKSIQMINVQSTWGTETIEEYMEDNQKQEEERKKQIKETKKLVHNILLNNQTVEAYQEKYHWDESKTFADNILDAAGKGKESMDDLKDMRQGKFKTLDPIKVTIKTGDRIKDGVMIKGTAISHAKANITLANADKLTSSAFKVYGYYEDSKKLKATSDEIGKLSKSKKEIDDKYNNCINDAKSWESPNFGREDRCMSLKNDSSLNTIINLVTDGLGFSENKSDAKKAAGIK